MTTINPTEAMAERLLAIDWTGGFDRTYSRVLLLKEYLRRSAWWAEALDCTARWPFFDVAGHIDPSVRADPVLVERVEEQLRGQTGWPPVKETCIWALHWAALRWVPGLPVPDLPDPFEPLLRMYERGGGFTTEHDFIQVDVVGVPVRAWHERRTTEQIAPLDDEQLDALDANWSRSR